MLKKRPTNFTVITWLSKLRTYKNSRIENKGVKRINLFTENFMRDLSDDGKLSEFYERSKELMNRVYEEFDSANVDKVEFAAKLHELPEPLLTGLFQRFEDGYYNMGEGRRLVDLPHKKRFEEKLNKKMEKIFPDAVNNGLLYVYTHCGILEISELIELLCLVEEII